MGDLEPVYNLFTIMGEIIPSVSLSRVTYTGINSMQSQKTKQPYIRSARKNRTRKNQERVREVLYKEDLWCRQIQENGWVDWDQLQEGSSKQRQPWGEFLEWNIRERAGRQKLDTRNEWKGWSILNTPGTRSRLRGGIQKWEEMKHSNRMEPYKSAKRNTII